MTQFGSNKLLLSSPTYFVPKACASAAHRELGLSPCARDNNTGIPTRFLQHAVPNLLKLPELCRIGAVTAAAVTIWSLLEIRGCESSFSQAAGCAASP